MIFRTKLPVVLFLACAVTLLNYVPLVSAHEIEPTVSDEITENDFHDDQAPTLEQEAQLLQRATKEGIGLNPEMRHTSQFAKMRNDPANIIGQWGNVQNWPVIPVFASLLYDGRVLAFDSVGDAPTESFQNHTFTRATIWTPTTNQFSNVRVDTGYNLFCSGFSSLPDGQLFIAGGNADSELNGLRETHLFSPLVNRWELKLDMQAPRWYPAVTPLANGEMLITGGGPAISEVRETDGQLRQLTGAAQNYWANRDYPWLQTAPDGRVAFFGPHRQLGYVSTSGTGSWQSMRQRDNATRSYGSYAMYDIGKALVTGGGKQGSGYDQRSSLIINLNNNRVSSTNSMVNRRRQHNLTVLADGSVLATGGFSSNSGLVDLPNAVFAAELWNPSTGKWTTLASESRARQYHSTALLLPDGRVLSGGGGICGTCQRIGYIQKNAQIFSPPYLFKPDGSGALASRPVITSAPPEVGYSQPFVVKTSQANQITKVGLVRTGSVTHSQNMEQRYIPLVFNRQNGKLAITSPNNANIAPPGHYMLFIIDGSGVPSVSKMIRIHDIPVPRSETAPQCDMGTDPQTISAGDSVPLWWWFEAGIGTLGSIDNSIGSISESQGYKWVSPTATTTYIMTVENAGGTGTCETTVTVEGQGEAYTPICSIGTYHQTIRPDEPTTIWWWSPNEVEKISIVNPDPGITFYLTHSATDRIPSDVSDLENEGTRAVYRVQQTTTFRMKVEERGRSGFCETTLVVN
ncbi:MAG: galactose oxidase early set domain-containing protein [Methylococcaceae bacterium]